MGAFEKCIVKVRALKQRKRIRAWYIDDGDHNLRLNYDLDKNSIVLDVGGFIGQWASDVFAKYTPYVYVFEPVASYANKIKSRFAKNDKIQVFDFGLGGSSRWEMISICGDASSVLAHFPKTKQESIRIVDVLDWVGQRNLPKIDLMKINIEGGEYELLDRIISSGLINKINDIQVQFHELSQKSRKEMERIQKDLARTHDLTYQYEFVWENWSRRQCFP